MTALHAAVAKLSPQSRALLLTRLEANMAHREAHRRFENFYPDTGPLRRELYPKHLQFFAAGRDHQERAFIAGNRTGKSSAASFELTAHLTGLYPSFWIGRRFTRPITAWAAGEDAKTVRETIQTALFGELSAPGTGMLPAELIVSRVRRAGVPEALDSAVIKHTSGGTSRVVLKSYDQQRESFQGARVDCGYAFQKNHCSCRLGAGCPSVIAATEQRGPGFSVNPMGKADSEQGPSVRPTITSRCSPTRT